MTSATALKFPVAPGSLELAKREVYSEGDDRRVRHEARHNLTKPNLT